MANYNKSGLIIENSYLAMAGRVHFADAKKVTIQGFDVLHASDGGFEYHTVICGEIWNEDLERKKTLGNLCGNIVSHYLIKYGISNNPRILFVGLGNPEASADSFGYSVTKKITPTVGIGNVAQVYSVPALIPDITGFETLDLVLDLKELSRADVIICADSLTALSRERLQTVIQITDVGISPGSAVSSNSSGIISQETMGVPVISIGVPMAIFEDVLTGDMSKSSILLTRAECELICSSFATIIAHGLRSAFLRKYP